MFHFPHPFFVFFVVIYFISIYVIIYMFFNMLFLHMVYFYVCCMYYSFYIFYFCMSYFTSAFYFYIYFISTITIFVLNSCLFKKLRSNKKIILYYPLSVISVLFIPLCRSQSPSSQHSSIRKSLFHLRFWKVFFLYMKF